MDEQILNTPRFRHRVLGPNESVPFDIYNVREGLEARQPLNQTAFREAERQYKKRKDMLDLSKVIDFSNLSGNTLENLARITVGVLEEKSDRLHAKLDLCELVDVPGFFFLPNAIPIPQQQYWVKQCLTEYSKHPNTSNLDALYSLPKTGIWEEYVAAYTREKQGLHFRSRITSKDHQRPPVGDSIAQLATDLETLIRKIRWITLGYQYDWTTKSYQFENSPVAFPADLASLASLVSSATGFGEDYRAEAGIVNYYQLGDSLTGHVDRSEKNMSAPLISISIGHSCIFLLGGPDRNDRVTAFYLRSGDLMILSGACRLNYHGVPRILEESIMVEDSREDDGDWPLVAKFIKGARININIRQVV